MTLKDAIWRALDDLDHRSSVEEIRLRAANYAKKSFDDISYQYAIQVRRLWRIENEVEGDNRTYDSQPRRNMLNDSTTNLQQVQRLNAFFNGKNTADQLIHLLGQNSKTPFHSIDQLINAVKELQQLQRKVAA
jgi:hypothetical protein